jgi:aminopeptidase N
MLNTPCRKCLLLAAIVLFVSTLCAVQMLAQTPQPTPTHADILRGEYGPYRANNDLLSYALDIRIDPEKKMVSGKNTIHFKMLKSDTRVQVDLYENLSINRIMLDNTALKYTRDAGAVFIDFPQTLKTGRKYAIDFYYSGTPKTIRGFGGLLFRTDPAGRPWIASTCEIGGASIWWPNKDQWHDEVENMTISVAAPNDYMDVSNGRFVGKKDLGDGYTRWDWAVSYPINSYGVSVNVGKYEHWSEKLGDLPLDFYALPEDLEKAKKQFTQAKGMLEAYQHYFGEYPFKKDGYKLVQAPYVGMEHQSAITYGNYFVNGFNKEDWLGVGIAAKFDYIIIHESGHEWFGNSVSAADISDGWIHEGWTTYLECLYVEYTFGHNDYLKYTNAYKKMVTNKEPVIAQRGISKPLSIDMYAKGALFLNTLRSIVNDDKKWFTLIRNFYQHFKYHNILTEDIVAYFNQQTEMNLTPVFRQYLWHIAIPKLELKFYEEAGTVSYRWKADELKFTMPIKVGTKDHWQIVQPTTEWESMKTSITKADFDVATDLYFIDVDKQT